jgi:hypothetical protein
VTDDLLLALRDPDGAVRRYAVTGLAGAGDGTAWEQVFAHVRTVARRESWTSGEDSATVCAVAYLGQFLDRERTGRLVAVVRNSWFLREPDEGRWFSRFWPDVIPGGPPAPAVTAPVPGELRAWVRHPLLTSRALP